jgi:hypothetical protein
MENKRSYTGALICCLNAIARVHPPRSLLGTLVVSA